MAKVEEKAILLMIDKVAGKPKIKKGDYKSIDELARRGQSGYVSTFSDCSDKIIQLVGIKYHGIKKLKEELGESMKLCVLKTSTELNEFGDLESIKDKTSNEIISVILNKLENYTIVVGEISTLEMANSILEFFLPKIDELNLVFGVIVGYKEGAEIPKFIDPPIVNPSWKIIGPDIVPTLSIENPMFYVTASKQLTRIDHVKSFDEDDIYENCCMGIIPICQFFREFSYYTGSSWKYGA